MSAAGLDRRLARWRVRLGFLTGAAVLLLAQPTWRSLAVGFVVAVAGEGVRVWAAGHLEKGKEVTRSGPYRYVRHPLYVGSAILASGVVVAANHLLIAVGAAVYMAATIAAAVRTEEADLRRAFGTAYDDYRASRSEPVHRRFSLARAIRNREYRAAAGVLIGFALFAVKAWLRL